MNLSHILQDGILQIAGIKSTLSIQPGSSPIMKIIQLTALLAPFIAAVLASVSIVVLSQIIRKLTSEFLALGPPALPRSRAREHPFPLLYLYRGAQCFCGNRSRADAPPPWSARAAYTKWPVARPRDTSPRTAARSRRITIRRAPGAAALFRAGSGLELLAGKREWM